MTRTLIILLFSTTAVAQNLQELTGVIRDAQTLEPIPLVTLIASGNGTTSNTRGEFTLHCLPHDTIRISHVNYQPHYTSSQRGDSLQIYLTPKDILLDELVIDGFPTENKLKRDLINTPAYQSFEVANAQYNVASTKWLLRSGFTPELDAADNFRIFMEGPQDVTFFSTHPSRGLGKVIRNLTTKSSFYRRPTISR